MDIETLKSLVTYNPITGVLKRKGDSYCGPRSANPTMGEMMLRRKLYRRTRLAWALAHGEWPKGRIYAVDGNDLNVALSNLSRLKPTGKKYRKRKTKVELVA
jgi:HNH endonuclease